MELGSEMAGNRLDEPFAGHVFSDHFGHTSALAYAVIWSLVTCYMVLSCSSRVPAECSSSHL